MKISLLAIGLLLGTACVARQKDPVSVNVGASDQMVKRAAVEILTGDHYALLQEGQFQFVFARDITGASGFFSKALLSPPACSSIAPRVILTAVFTGSTISGALDYERAGPFCRLVRDHLDDKNARANLENILQQIKLRAEILQNSKDSQGSPAAAAALANGHTKMTPDQVKRAIEEGKASRASVVTNPAGAAVYIDGNLAGNSPIAFFLFKEDTPRVVSVKLDGYKGAAQSFTPDGKNIPIAFDLEKETK
jgi:hypothetical protein